MDIPSAEMTKYAANAMLATRISFMNDIANLCDKVGADIDMVRKGIGTDARIGNKFLYAGCGYGGSCFPKDVRALARTGREYGSPMRIIEAVEAVNERQKEIVVRKLAAELGDLRGRTVALWGLAFKPETDDMQRSARPGGDRPLDTRRRCGESLRSGGDGRMPPQGRGCRRLLQRYV